MARDIGIDLGTANSLIHLKGRGIILNEPSVLAYDRKSQEVIAIGNEAYPMLGRTPASIEVVQPLKGGVINDYELTEAFLLLCFKKLRLQRGFRSTNVLISAPSSITDIERLSLYEAVQKVSSGKVYIEPEPLVAAVGAGLEVLDSTGNMIVDIGGGTTDIAIISAGEILYSESLKIAGDDFDEAIINYLKEYEQILVGLHSAEALKKQLASALKQEEPFIKNIEIKGRDLVTGLPKAVNVDSNDLFQALQDLLLKIARATRRVLEQAPPEIMADIHDQGIIVTGGGALIQDIDLFLSDQLKVTVVTSDHPLTAVALGTGTMLEWITMGRLDRSNKKQKIRRQRWRRFWRRIIG